ncbi:SDR family NAD(P)-dependent oxidoreductase [Pedobacter sandarakinus]|uniref:SDR family NAD(P)-dependent oxidoreductase n=1 Tax=Pedobacter sandarakinus TaxID=353156 RepID=UPI002247D341|nr:SDR family oxidoreductase [Pedobacter sandarakinus]MCX2574095.1 SDR family NAD(P)-dependent oxidoreductase [Pedobacter sandarakinus]
MRFKDKNILVVGGSSGIGLDLVSLLAKEGANVYTISRSENGLWPSEVKYLKLDILGELDAVKAFLPEQLHGMAYCVGNINLKPFSRVSEKDFVDDFRLNVVSAAMIIQLGLNAMKNAGSSSIILMSSVAAKTGMGFHASIAASKAAIEGLAVSLAAELSSQHIRVNVVAPSLTNTPLAERLLNTPEKMEAAAKRHPLGKFGQPKDISATIAFLLSTESEWITGQIIAVDGGMGSLRTNL